MGDVVSIPAALPFAETLAAEMLGRHGADGDNRLADALILLPTRRAVRSLSQAFLRAADGRAMVLPRIQPLGDLDDDEPAMLSPDRLAEAETPPAIGAMARRMLLARLILARDDMNDAAAALGLARSLADLLDEVATERLDFAKLKDLAPERFQEHWQETIDFLRIVTDAWPALLAERDQIDPAARRDRLAAGLAEAWRADPPDHPAWIAGSTGSVPGTADLMAAVLGMRHGRIVLPGLDADLDERDRDAARKEPVHPQHGMLLLLQELGVDPQSVGNLGGAQPTTSRQLLLTEALRPASTTERWGDLSGIDASALEGVSLIRAQSPREEAAAIAIRLREALDTPGKTAALVTPDRDLARRVAAEMARFGVAIDDSAGAPLRLTRAGGFLQLAAQALSGGFAPADLLALLKHPLAAGGMEPARFRREVRRLERRQLRGLRRYDTLQELAERGENDPEYPLDLGWLREMARIAEGFTAAEGDFSAMLRAHVTLCEWLAASDAEEGAARLWQGEDGEAAANAVSGLLEAAIDAPPIEAAQWAAGFDGLAGGATVRPRYGLHPRLGILGPLEARLQRFDLTILGGLNENVWPAAPGRDPWMSRPMRADFGLPSPERRTGLQAHDFMQLAATGEIVLTRSLKAGGAPTVPSRWLLRLQSVATGADLEIPEDALSTRWAIRLDQASSPTPITAPTPRPPAEARPVRLPVTAIETLIRDPYAIYARRILRLKPLDPIDDTPGPLLKGIIMHEAFERLARAHPRAWSMTHWPELQRIGHAVLAEEGLPDAWLALWTRRFESAAQWLLKTESERTDGIDRRLVEIEGELHGLAGLPDFVLTAKADRLDLLTGGGVVIADYKTGSPPSKKQIEAGFAVQLPLTGLILRSGGFADAPDAEVAELVHIQVHGAREGGAWKPVKTEDLEELITETADGVAALLAEYADPATPYRSRPHVQFAGRHAGDYDHLARVAEWSVASDEGGAE